MLLLEELPSWHTSYYTNESLPYAENWEENEIEIQFDEFEEDSIGRSGRIGDHGETAFAADGNLSDSSDGGYQTTASHAYFSSYFCQVESAIGDVHELKTEKNDYPIAYINGKKHKCVRTAWLTARSRISTLRKPTCWVLDIGCTRSMGSRRAMLCFCELAKKQGIEVIWERAYTDFMISCGFIAGTVSYTHLTLPTKA